MNTVLSLFYLERELSGYIRDIRLVVCNTIMTAHVVVDLANRGIPHMWILHEWWPRDMMVR